MFPFRNRRRSPKYQRIRRDSDERFDGSLLESSDIENNHEKFSTHATSSAKSLLGYVCINPYRLCGAGRGKWKRLFFRCVFSSFLIVYALVILTPIFNPSYSRRPSHYTGTNPHNEKVFIAANIIDEDMIRGAWGKAVQELVELIGPQNVYLSVYENDSGPNVRAALRELAAKVKCRSNVITGHIDLDKYSRVQILPGDSRIKRITYLAEVRNNAIEPIDSTSASNTTHLDFDKLLFLNDVVFSPKDAADLLFATNMQEDGRTDYQAACGMDYINTMKFYDRFAMRDNEYYETGLPFFPWFIRGGERAESWHDVVAESDAVRVKSCWGGIVAFEAKWFRKAYVSKSNHALEPLRFRSELDTFWDASECCLIHADLEELVKQESNQQMEAKIFVNPYIRVAYDKSTFMWLEFTRRFERLFILPHMVIGWFLRMPWSAIRRMELPNQEITRKEWVYNEPEHVKNLQSIKWNLEDIPKFGKWRTAQRQSEPGGYCGFPFLLALKNQKTFKQGERKWEKIFAPPGFEAR